MAHPEMPQFRAHDDHGALLDMPSRDEMLAAVLGGVLALLFKATTLAEGTTTVIADEGGLDEQAPFVWIACEHAAVLARMYEALREPKGEEAANDAGE
jgi:hypothetical protein